MITKHVALLSFCIGSLVVSGCSKEAGRPLVTNAASAPTTAVATTTTAAPGASRRTSACEMVTQAEMSAILGGAVKATPVDKGRTSTECDYAGPDDKPYAELQVDWNAGDPEVLGKAAGLAQGAGPAGAVGGLQGLGDRAYQVTASQVFISAHGHLMMIRFLPGTSDVLGMARRIYETANARM